MSHSQQRCYLIEPEELQRAIQQEIQDKSKMDCFEKDEYNRLRQQQLKDYDPALASLANLRMEMNKQLNRKDLDAHKQMSLYVTAKHRFDDLKNSTNLSWNKLAHTAQAIDPVKKATNPEPDNEDDEPPQIEMSELDYSIPRQYEHKHAQLLDLLDRYPNSIATKSDGTLVLNGAVVPGSSTSDLIRSFYITSSKHNLTGRTRLFNVMRELKVPIALLSNKDSIKSYEGQIGQGAVSINDKSCKPIAMIKQFKTRSNEPDYKPISTANSGLNRKRIRDSRKRSEMKISKPKNRKVLRLYK